MAPLEEGPDLVIISLGQSGKNWGDGLDAPRRHLCAIVEVFEHH